MSENKCGFLNVYVCLLFVYIICLLSYFYNYCWNIELYGRRNVIYLPEIFYLFCRWDLGAFSRFTHTLLLLHILSEALYLSLSKLRFKRGCIAILIGMYFLFLVFVRVSTRVCSFYLSVHSKFFTNCCGWCNKVSHNFSDLESLGIMSYPVCAFIVLDP